MKPTKKSPRVDTPCEIIANFLAISQSPYPVNIKAIIFWITLTYPLPYLLSQIDELKTRVKMNRRDLNQIKTKVFKKCRRDTPRFMKFSKLTLNQNLSGADEGIRTLDFLLGKEACCHYTTSA